MENDKTLSTKHIYFRDNIIGLASIGFPHVKNVYDDAMFSRLPEDISEDDVQENYRSISSISKDRSQFKNELSKIVPHTVENESSNNLDFLNYIMFTNIFL
jgi:hypothetical protein